MSLFQVFRIGEHQKNVKHKHLFYIAARRLFTLHIDIACSYWNILLSLMYRCYYNNNVIFYKTVRIYSNNNIFNRFSLEMYKYLRNLYVLESSFSIALILRGIDFDEKKFLISNKVHVFVNFQYQLSDGSFNERISSYHWLKKFYKKSKNQFLLFS